MERKVRTRILVEGDRTVLDQLAREIEQMHDVALVKEPTEELAMLRVRESAQRSQFYLGEALMTSCVVRIGDAYGYGMVMGEDHDKAFDLAVVDAAYTLDPVSCENAGWNARLAESDEHIQAKQRKRNEALLRTQVDFSTMEV